MVQIFVTIILKKIFPETKLKYQNNFICKFSKKRNRFYVYMLAVDKKSSSPLKEFCKDIIESWPELSDHMDKNLLIMKENTLKGFFVDNLFNNKVLNFSNQYKKRRINY